MIDAAYVVERIGKGVREALKTNQLFLGVEQFEFENADIRPEYVTTVKVAEQLTDPEFFVSLEARMKTLRPPCGGNRAPSKLRFQYQVGTREQID